MHRAAARLVLKGVLYPQANPPQLERCEDIASLRCLNECGALHVLRARYAAGLPHSRAGPALLVLGPPRRTAPIYTDKVTLLTFEGNLFFFIIFGPIYMRLESKDRATALVS